MKKHVLIPFIIAYSLMFSSVHAQNWKEIGTGNNALQTGYSSLTAISSDSSGNIYAIGNFYDANYKTSVMKWNGTSWSKLGNFAPSIGTIKCLCTDKDGNVYVGGDFVNSTSLSHYSYFVNKWDGTSWSEVGGVDALNANSTINLLVADDAGNIYATGAFTQHNSPNYHFVAKWDGTAWSELDAGGLDPDSPINAMTVRDGNLYVVGGKESGVNGNQNVFVWDGSAWSEIGSNSNSNVFKPGTVFSSIGVAPNGDVYVGNDNKDANNKHFVAKWNGTTWIALPVEVPTDQHSIVHVDYYGNVYTAFLELNSSNAQKASIKKLSGSTWNDLGNLNGSNLVYTLYSDKKANLFAAGLFQDATPNTYVAEYGTGTAALSVVLGTYIDNNIKIYPNPAKDVVTVDVPSDIIGTPYYIYDSRAVLYASGILTAGSTTLNVDHLSTGLYFVQLGDLSKNAFKLIKK